MSGYSHVINSLEVLVNEEVMDPVLDGFDRGFPPQSQGLRVSAIGAQGWRLHENFDTPIATLRSDRLEHNARLMRDWCTSHEAELWPHAKTVMSPQLIALQLANGATGFTAATVAQARLLLDWGVPGVLIANQIVSLRTARYLTAHVSRTKQQLVCYVDSTIGANALHRAAQDAGIVVDVLLELGSPGARTGVRSIAEAEKLRQEIDQLPGTRLVGVAGYEGSFGGDRSDPVNSRVEAYLATLVELLSRLHERRPLDVDRPVLSAGGSMHFDFVAAAASALTFVHKVVVRSGCYLLHDVGLFANASPLLENDGVPGLRAALSVWGTVNSRPEPGRAYLDVGRRDAGFDQGLPQPLNRWSHHTGTTTPLDDATTLQLNDQHLHLGIESGTELEIGDRVEFGVSHPCTTMDKWRTLAVVDTQGSVVGAASTRF